MTAELDQDRNADNDAAQRKAKHAKRVIEAMAGFFRGGKRKDRRHRPLRRRGAQ